MKKSFKRRPRRFFSENILTQSGEQIFLNAGESVHLRTTLRLDPGAVVLLTDPSGREAEAVIEGYEADGRAALKLIELGPCPQAGRIFVRLYAAMAKGGVTDELVEKASELGIEEFHPIVTERTEVRTFGEKSQRQLERWYKIAREAAKQSGGRKELVLFEPEILAQAVKKAGPTGRHVFLDPYEGDAVDLKTWLESMDLLLKKQNHLELNLYFGPEGGFSRPELEAARKTLAEAGAVCHWVHLGARLLRLDTAVVSVLAAVKLILT